MCMQAVDEAKKRAVAQHVDYETFKNMVLVAHLRPLHAPNHRQEGDRHAGPTLHVRPTRSFDQERVSTSAAPCSPSSSNRRCT